MNYHRNRGKRSENIIALICLLLAFNSISWPQDRVIGYYPSWMRSTLPPGTIKFEYLTLINHAFAWPLADGTITGGSDLLFPDLNVAVHQAAKRILISLGGAGESGGFSAMAADSTTRTRFVGNLVTFLVSNGYDGVDIDWEFPQTNADKGNLVTLVKQIREVFQNTDSTWLITLAAPAGDYNGRWFDYSALKDDVDWFNVLTYDFHGSWTNHAGHNAPLYAPPTDYDGSVHEAIVYLSNTRRVPKNKIVLGLPFYGKEFIADSMYGESTGATDLLYSAIAPRLQQGSGWTYHWDDVSKVPYLTNSQNSRVVTFDDSVSLSIKCKYAKDNTLSGVMFWAMGQDVIGSNQPLVEAVGKAMVGTTGVVMENSINSPNEFELFNNYPNPFNPTTTIGYRISSSNLTKLAIYDPLGRVVATLVNEVQSAGEYRIPWDASNLSPGLYFYQLITGSGRMAKKILYIK